MTGLLLVVGAVARWLLCLAARSSSAHPLEPLLAFFSPVALCRSPSPTKIDGAVSPSVAIFVRIRLSIVRVSGLAFFERPKKTTDAHDNDDDDDNG